ncbi:MAG: hypothetical protein HY303_20400 [Candidatus Wallbacteria bacterium]|nr:hypothetical protein [Candidatus Wallbacteria bacterium]
MNMHGTARSLLWLAATLVAAATAAAQVPGFGDLATRTPERGRPPAEAPRKVDLEYSLRARLRSFLVKADFWAGGKLLMDARRQPDGRTLLSLARVEEQPWKFMWFAPKAIGAQAGYAADVTLAAGTWPARKAAEGLVEKRAREVHRQWQQEWQGTQPLNWFFQFYIIGDPLGRFSTAIEPGGRVSATTNRMTGRWLPRGFQNWLDGKAEEGYGYWGEEPQPPEYAPRCYEAFAQAMELLSHPVLPASAGPGRLPDAGSRYSLVYAGELDAGRKVLETLAPKARDRFKGTCTFEMSGVVGSGDSASVTLRSPPVKPADGQGIEARFSREAVLDRRTLECARDRAHLELSKGSESSLVLDVGYRPHEE